MPDSRPAADQVLAALRAQVAAVVPDVDPARVVPGASLEQLGCSSMDRAEITVLTMEDLRVTLSARELTGARDVTTLVGLLAAKLTTAPR